tara:strand:+ start:193 stop:1008 length:816 start_codon:yes stop_codon:yes gene_type:complete
MKKVSILGCGPSVTVLENKKLDDVDEIIMINNHASTVNNDKILKNIKDKELYIMCNITQTGFNHSVFSKIDVKKCLTNRLKPDWELWQENKDAQKKHHEGGLLNNLDYLPFLAEDEPYLYAWRGPKNRNRQEMFTYDDRQIEHMPEEAEQYLIPVYRDKLVCNCSYMASLYAILVLGADHIEYYGLDFYNNIEIKKSWYASAPKYSHPDWWNLRNRYEGEHMKALYDDYLPKFFPNVKFDFFTALKHKFSSSNVTCNTVDISDDISDRTWY